MMEQEPICDVKIMVYAKRCDVFTDRLLSAMDHSKNYLDLGGTKLIYDPYVSRDDEDPRAPAIITGWIKWWADFDICSKWALSLFMNDDSILRVKTFVTDPNTLAAACFTTVRYGDTIKLYSQSISDDRFDEIIFRDDDPEEVDELELENRYAILEEELEQQRRESLVCIDLPSYRQGEIRIVNTRHNER